MKKLFSLFLISAMLSNAFAFTSNDVSVAQMLADQKVINNHANDPLQYRLDATITRAELLKIALKIRTLEVPASYTCQGYFTDVNAKQDWICSVVEMAADNDIITRENKTFRPQDTVTRAEALAILMKAKKIEIQTNCWGVSCDGITIDSTIPWHANVFLTGLYAGLASPEKMVQDFVHFPSTIEYTFRPNDRAKRREVFGFASNIVNYLPYIPQEVVSTGILTTDELSNLKKDAYIQGNKDALILVVEFADLQCPFCKRMHDDEVIKHLEAKYGNQLAFSFQHFPLPFHELALPAAHTAECVAEQGGSDAYYTFIDKLFSKETPTQTSIDDVLSQMNLANDTLRTCVKNLKYQSKIDTQMVMGTNLGVAGTPGTLIINTKTGNYEIVSGAQPEANFVEVVDRLLK